MNANSLPRGQAEMLASMTPEQQKVLLEKLLRAKAAKSNSFPMSAGQQGLWHAYRRDPKSVNFNVFLPTRLRSRVDVSALEKTLNLVVKRHASLRTTFSDQSGNLVQIVHPELKPVFCRHFVHDVDDKRLQDQLSRVSTEPFDLEKGPLLRFHVYERSPEDTIILALTHHIVTDFWSLVLILNEIREAYPSFSNGMAPNLTKPVNNYSEFVRDQQKYLSSSKADRDRQFWKRTVEGVSPVLTLPTDYVRPTKFTGRAKNVELKFESIVVKRITELARSNRATSFAVVQSALQVLLSRYSGEKSFLIGTPFSGRSQRIYEPTVGFFVNMLPLKADLEKGDPSFADLVKSTSLSLLDALEHENYPVAQIVSDANVPRDASRSPLFQVNCTFEKAHLRDEAGRAGFLFPGQTEVFDFAGMKQESFYVPVKTCHYDLEFVFEQTESQLRGLLCYCQDLFSEDTAQKIAENFSSLLSSLLANPHQPISRVPWRMHSHPENQLNRLGESTVSSSSIDELTPQSEANATSVDRLIRIAAEHDLQAPAIHYRGRTMTYAQFTEGSQRLANSIQRFLSQQGNSQPEATPIIPIVAERGPQAIMAMQGVHLAGAAFIPLDVNHLAVSLLDMLGDSTPPLILADKDSRIRLRSLLPEGTDALKIPIIEISDAQDIPKVDGAAGEHGIGSDRPITDPESQLNTDDGLAYIVFTSGSTGKPKGVMLDHRAVCNTLNWRRKDVPLSTDDRVLMLLSHQFDAGLAIAWTTLSQGATLVIADEEETQDPSRLINLMHRERVTVLPAPPSVQGLLWNHARINEVADQLKYVWTGGEQVPSTLPALIRSKTRAQFFNFYGPTETAIEATYCNITEHPEHRMVSIGRPIDGAEVLIVDEYQHPVPDTVPGEIAIGGVGLARGYLNDPTLTAKKFVPHPLGHSGQSDRVYLTGDRGRRTAAGDIEFLGRTDHQVKLRGYRIELGEIDATLESCPLVDRAATVIQGDGADATLVAYVSLYQSGKQLPGESNCDNALSPVKPPIAQICSQHTAAIRRFVDARLSPFKRPTTIAVFDYLPETASGKVDRKRLPSLEADQCAAAEYLPPETPLEEFLADAWKQILGIERIGIQQNFFDAGGSSLQAAMLSSSLSEQLGVDVPTSLLFDLADISQIAVRLVELHPSAMASKFGEHCIAEQLERSADRMQDTLPAHPLIATYGSSSRDMLTTPANRQPLFMVHPPGGIVVCYRELALRLAQDVPVVGIRSRGLHGEETLPATIEEMAADYLRAVLSVQNNGPYQLGGWSLGGLVAYEVAQQLTSLGETVSRLVLLDTTIPEGASELVPIEEQVNVGLEYGIEMTLDQLGDLSPEDQLPFLWEHAKKLGVLDDDSPPEVVAKALEDLQGLFHHHIALASEYRMQPAQFPILLMRPTETPVELNVAEDRGWKHLCASVKVQFVPGHHHSMVQPPHVEQLAVQLQRLLHS